MTTMTQSSERVGLFFVRYEISSGLLGAPGLHLALTVNTVDKVIHGAGRVTQSTNPPLDLRTRLDGNYTYMTVMPKATHILVVATGNPVIDWPAHGGIGPAIPPNLHLRLVLEDNWRSGVAWYQYQTSDGTWQEVKDVPVRQADPTGAA